MNQEKQEQEEPGKFCKLYLLFRLYWSRGYSHPQIFISFASFMMLLSTMLQVFNIMNIYIVICTGILGIAAIVVIGWFDVKIGFMKKEMSIHNQNNPEIQKLLRK